MHNLTAAEMLTVWEQGLHRSPVQRAIILLAAAFPEMSSDTLLRLSIGRRDGMLLQLREYLFGPQLVNTAVCLQCEQQIEWKNRVADFIVPMDTAESFEMQEGNYFLRFRSLNSLDIDVVVEADSPSTAQPVLLNRCLLRAEHSGESCTADELPEDIVQKLMQQIQESDPMAEICIRLTCPECSHSWDALFDITSFLWSEINDWALRMLRTVHKLAVGYGWSESEILALSLTRRQLYLGMLGG